MRAAVPAPPEMVQEVLVASRQDETPLEYMLRVMRDHQQPIDRRDKMAISVAPYLHPKLQGVAFQMAPLPAFTPGNYLQDQNPGDEASRLSRLELARRIAFTMADGARLAKKG